MTAPQFATGKTHKTALGKDAFVGYERDGLLFGDIKDRPVCWTPDGRERFGRAEMDLVAPGAPRITSEKHAFINRLRSMTCIDGWQLPELPKHEQLRFMADPFGFLMRADAAQSDAIWREIEKRQGKNDA